MTDFEGRQTKRAVKTLAAQEQWSVEDKRRLSAMLTLAMLANGQAGDVTPQAMQTTTAFLAECGVDLAAEPSAIGAALDKALAAKAPPRALAKAAEQIVVDDIARRQSARLRRARKFI